MRLRATCFLFNSKYIKQIRMHLIRDTTKYSQQIWYSFAVFCRSQRVFDVCFIIFRSEASFRDEWVILSWFRLAWNQELEKGFQMRWQIDMQIDCLRLRSIWNAFKPIEITLRFSLFFTFKLQFNTVFGFCELPIHFAQCHFRFL